MSTRGDPTETYSEAKRILKENWSNARGEVVCPDCNLRQIEYLVDEKRLITVCDYCQYSDFIRFRGEVPWSENF